MKIKPILQTAVAAALSLVSLGVWAANEVSLFKVENRFNFSRAGGYVSRIEALVTNLGYRKQVALHVKKPDGTWADVPFRYNRPANGGKEVWSADYFAEQTNAIDLEFAIKYDVNGQTYWDSNNGANYVIKNASGSYLVGTNVYNGKFEPTATVGGTAYSGYVTVKNLSAAKQVKVIYSTDNWATSKTAIATYDPNFWYVSPNPNQYGFEEWNFTLDVGAAGKVDYAISYTVNGQTYWDNNFGYNYSTVLVR